MKKFDIPEHYRSAIIGEIKNRRKDLDPRKQDFSPGELSLGNITFIFPRHFGFCYGVENAIERSYKAIRENPGKRLFLLSQMIHNPAVNEDLEGRGLKFILDTEGRQLHSWDDIHSDDVVIIPAFGTTIETPPARSWKRYGSDLQKLAKVASRLSFTENISMKKRVQHFRTAIKTLPLSLFAT